MGMTITEKNLADHAGKQAVDPGELIDGTLAAGGLMKYVAQRKRLAGRSA